jgi:hypothetical protein
MLPLLVGLAVLLASSAAAQDARDTRALQIVAHQDDDLLFMQPDIVSSIRAGATSRTIYVTAGDAGGSNPFLQREAGILDAYAAMAGVPNAWTEGTATWAGKTTRTYTLTAVPRVSVVFVRLYDGFPDGHVAQSLQNLWDGNIGSISALSDPNNALPNTFTRDELIAYLEGAIVSFAPDVIRTLDSTHANGWDHSDHYHSAMFALAAAQRIDPRTRVLRNYRTYNTSFESENLSSTEHLDACAIFNVYAAHDGEIGSIPCGAPMNTTDDYVLWGRRRLAISSLLRIAAPLSAEGLCLGSPSQANGTKLELQSCAGSAQQTWELLANGQVRNLAGKCLEIENGSSTDGTPALVWDCLDLPSQHWTLSSNGQLRGIQGICLDARGEIEPGAPVTAHACGGDDFQRFVSRPDGTLRLQNLCLDVETGGGVPFLGAAVQIWSCVGSAPQQLWSAPASGAITLQTPDGRCMNVDGAGGIGARVSMRGCNNQVQQQWTRPGDGTVRGLGGLCLSLRVANVAELTAKPDRGNDLFMDVCADVRQRWVPQMRGTSAWGVGNQFSAIELGEEPSLYGSFGLGDIDGDGFADACARYGDGVHCGLNDRSSRFEPRRLYTGEFSDALGWGPAEYGSTLRYPDVNGDGRADACGRGDKGILCATANAAGTAFVSSDFWTTDFDDDSGAGSDRTRYGSIRFGDVNGDGFDDVCARDATGIRCGLNTQSGAFAPSTVWIAPSFEASLGLPPTELGLSLELGDIDADGRADVCERGSAGVVCAVANATGTGFVNASLRSFRADFSNAGSWHTLESYFRSIRLADLTGDGLPDLCGRSAQGIVCGVSSGSRFDQVHKQINDYTDGLAWWPTEHGTTLRWKDLDADGSEDVCGVGDTQLLCATLVRSVDSDGDGVLDGLDNCRFAPDPALADTGRVGGPGADGIGNACQCGDLDLDGAVTAPDVSRYRAFLANPFLAPLSLAESDRCAVARPLSGECSVRDVVVLRRAVLANLAPGVSQICGAASPE